MVVFGPKYSITILMYIEWECVHLLSIRNGVFQSEVLFPLPLVIAGMGVVDAVIHAEVGMAQTGRHRSYGRGRIILLLICKFVSHFHASDYFLFKF